MAHSVTLSPTPTQTRVTSIDALRGLVMILMALDHTRDYLHRNAMYYDATNLATTTASLFFTRWITHFCAPTFVFLAGISAYLSGSKKSPGQLSRFLLTRGLWLVLLELTVMNFAFWFDPSFSFVQLQVIWAIGISMVVLSGLVFLPRPVLLVLGLLLVAGHNTLDGIHFPEGTAAAFGWSLLHRQQVFVFGGHKLLVLYPLLPWIGVMLLGYCAGTLYRMPLPTVRKKILLEMGLLCLGLFVLLRLLNVYGDPRPWQEQVRAGFTFLSFLNVTKYPPSLLYLCLTLGVGLLSLSAMEGRSARWMSIGTVYGRVPLFYYVLHFYLIHLLALAGLLLSGTSWSEIDFTQGNGGIRPGQGLDLGWVYVCWMLIVLSFYPMCRWYHRFRSGRQNPIWRYL